MNAQDYKSLVSVLKINRVMVGATLRGRPNWGTHGGLPLPKPLPVLILKMQGDFCNLQVLKMANDAYLVTETPPGNKKIEILTHPDLPTGALLLEFLVLNLALTLLTFVFRGFFALNLLGILAFPVYLIWNKRAKDSLELTEKYLRLLRHRPPFLSAQPSYQKK